MARILLGEDAAAGDFGAPRLAWLAVDHPGW